VPGLVALVPGETNAPARAIARGRAEEENRRAAACPADHTAVVGEGAIARGRGAVEGQCAAAEAADRAAIVGEGSQTSRGRAVREYYLSNVAGSINSSHKVLCDPWIVRDPGAADGQR